MERLIEEKEQQRAVDPRDSSAATHEQRDEQEHEALERLHRNAAAQEVWALPLDEITRRLRIDLIENREMQSNPDRVAQRGERHRAEQDAEDHCTATLARITEEHPAHRGYRGEDADDRESGDEAAVHVAPDDGYRRDPPQRPQGQLAALDAVEMLQKDPEQEVRHDVGTRQRVRRQD